MAFNLEAYQTVAERLKIALDTHAKDDIRIITDLLHVQRDEAGKPIQYICRTQIYFGNTLKAQDIAEEMVGSSNVNRNNAMENASTSSLGRCLGLIGFLGVDPETKKPIRPTREDMQKDARIDANKVATAQQRKVEYTAEQIASVRELMAKVGDEALTMEGLKSIYEQANALQVTYANVDGTTLNTLIGKRKKELEKLYA